MELVFDPATEFEVLESFDFQEEVERPENLRFYTLDDQLTDFVEKSLPAGHPTRFQIEEIHKARDRLREVYQATIDSNFELRPHRVQTRPSWVHPLHPRLTYRTYNWNSLNINRTTPNAYPRLLLSLPSPYSTQDDGSPAMTHSDTFVDEYGIEVRGLGRYERTRAILTEEGIRQVVSMPIENTQDDIRVSGYSLDIRPLSIPNPLPDHPFLSSSDKSIVQTTEPFVDVYPSIQAILHHAVPITSDVYTTGLQYLRLYDVRMQDIMWDLWKQRFPPVDAGPTHPVVSIPFPQRERAKPSENLLSAYSEFQDGMDSYLWLMTQVDGGALVPTMLRSLASDVGLVPVIPIGEVVAPQFPKSSATECLHSGSFDEFINSGVFRTTECIPASYIQHERTALVSHGRMGWKESTKQDILRDYLRLVQRVSVQASRSVAPVYKPYQAPASSPLRAEVVAILADTKRLDSDKQRAIHRLVNHIVPTNHIIYDGTAFVVCEHTWELLDHPDMDPFYRKWTLVESGFRVCKYCGEQINRDVFMAQTEFDDDGHAVISHEALPVQTTTSHTTANLASLKHLFELDKGKIRRMVLYLLLSLFQVVPIESQLVPVLSFMDKASDSLKKGGKLTDDIDGTLGLVGMAILLQTHSPFLIPRRSFGSKRLVFSGFPRDSADKDKVPVINTILFVMRSTFESFPTTFSGKVGDFMRSTSLNSKQIRNYAVDFLGKASGIMKETFADARIRFEQEPEKPETEQMTLPAWMNPPAIQAKSVQYHPWSFIECSLPPNVEQDPLRLHSKIVARHPVPIVYKAEAPIQLGNMSEATIREKIKKGFPATLKMPVLKSYIETERDGIALMSLLSRVLDFYPNTSLRTTLLDLQTRTDLLADSVRGLLYEYLATLDPASLATHVKQDGVFQMIVMKQENALKEDRGLRARERETLKSRLRQKNDAEREILKMLLDLGIAPYILTNEDRQQFAQEFEDASKEDGEDVVVVQGREQDGDVEDNENEVRGDRDIDVGIQGPAEIGD